jgi:hypothetical protein
MKWVQGLWSKSAQWGQAMRWVSGSPAEKTIFTLPGIALAPSLTQYDIMGSNARQRNMMLV